MLIIFSVSVVFFKIHLSTTNKSLFMSVQHKRSWVNWTYQILINTSLITILQSQIVSYFWCLQLPGGTYSVTSLSLQIFVNSSCSLFHHRLHSWECKTSRQNIVEGNCWNRVAPSPTLIKLTADEAVIAQLIIIYAALKENCYTLIRYANHQDGDMSN